MKTHFKAVLGAVLVAILLFAGMLTLNGSNQHSPPEPAAMTVTYESEKISAECQIRPVAQFEVVRQADIIGMSVQGDSGDTASPAGNKHDVNSSQYGPDTGLVQLRT